MDPFCAFYLQEGHVNYTVGELGEDGFTVTNPLETQFKGKFWKARAELTPPLRDNSPHA